MKKLIVLFLSLFMISTSVNAAEIPPESLPSNATFDCMEYIESFIKVYYFKLQENGLVHEFEILPIEDVMQSE